MGGQEKQVLRVGKAEEAALVALLERGGLWKKEPGCWVWENTHWTARVMDRLVCRGLATIEAQDTHYTLTRAGLLLAGKLLREVPQVFPPQQAGPVQLPRQGSYRAVGGRRRQGS